ACSTECPSNVNLALLKAELLHARIRQNGLSLKQRIFSGVDFLGALGCKMPRVANMFLISPIVRTIVSRTLGISSARTLPPYARQRFDKWFKR
ncbi:hypothetical protein, partial [Bacillus pumilus]|uniref:hypothetical protein n=1 Tax=Bacillus pumilus TaxID=1408 RepID=UPI001C9B7520